MAKFFEKHLFICTSGKTCPKKGPVDEILAIIKNGIKEKGLKNKIRVNKSGCLDWCDEGPVMVCYPEGIWYTDVQLEDAQEILEEHLVKGNPVERLIYKKENNS